MQIGIISDTHGTISPGVLDALRGSECILHAGDIGAQEVLSELARIAPVRAVRGNTDAGVWARELPHTEMVCLCNKIIFILHDLATLDLDPTAAGIQLVVSGHTHQAEFKIVKDILYFNPGSASVRRYSGPLTVGRIQIFDHGLIPEIIQVSG